MQQTANAYASVDPGFDLKCHELHEGRGTLHSWCWIALNKSTLKVSVKDHCTAGPGHFVGYLSYACQQVACRLPPTASATLLAGLADSRLEAGKSPSRFAPARR